MNSGSTTISARDLTQGADSFGYRYELLSAYGSRARDEDPLFEGTLGVRRLPCGLVLHTCDLRALRDSGHAGQLPRSLTIRLPIVRTTGNTEISIDGHAVEVSDLAATMISAPDDFRLAGAYRKNQRHTCLFVMVQPEGMVDEELAERVEALLRSTHLFRFPGSGRVLALAEDLFAPRAEGALGRLLAESCALELLAQGLMSAQGNLDGRAVGISKHDQTRMLRLRDKLIAAPEQDYRLSDLAREAGVSATSLKTKFAAVVGQSVFAFLRDQRLERARKGLESEGWTVSQAAYFVGFRHPSNFSTAFRRKFGTPPSGLRSRPRSLDE